MEKIKVFLKTKTIIIIILFSLILTIFFGVAFQLLSFFKKDVSSTAPTKEALVQNNDSEINLTNQEDKSQYGEKNINLTDDTEKSSENEERNNSKETTSSKKITETKEDNDSEESTIDENNLNKNDDESELNVNGVNYEHKISEAIEMSNKHIVEPENVEEMPQAVFDADTMELSNMAINTKYKYSVDGGDTYSKFTITKPSSENNSGKHVITGVTEKYGIWIICSARNSRYADSPIQKITVSKAEAPNVAVINANTYKGMGRIVGVTINMGYRLENSNTWSPITKAGNLELPAGNYDLCVMGKGTVLASDIITLEITQPNRSENSFFQGKININIIIDICKIISLIVIIYIIVMCVKNKT